MGWKDDANKDIVITAQACVHVNIRLDSILSGQQGYRSVTGWGYIIPDQSNVWQDIQPFLVAVPCIICADYPNN
jgi:hypothetical protein